MIMRTAARLRAHGTGWQRGWLLACLCCLATAGARAEGGLSFQFEMLDGPSAGARFAPALDAGVISAQRIAGARSRAHSRHRVLLRLVGGPAAPATARVSAWLPHAPPGVTVSVDGVALSAAPRLLDPAHRVGVPVMHRIELLVDGSVPPGPLLQDIQWMAETP